jgi:uncharacterized protein (UPF0216 family)
MSDDAGRYRISWDELESIAHVAVEDQVEMLDVSVSEPMVTPEELDRQKAFGIAGDILNRR